MSKYTPKVYTILISRDLKNQKVGINPPPTIHHQNKKKVSAFKSEILIKYKRIKWTPSCKASLLLPGGKVSVIKSEILIKYKRLKWTLAVRLRSYSQGDKKLSIKYNTNIWDRAGENRITRMGKKMNRI